MHIPPEDNIDEPFILAFERSPSNKKKFYFHYFITTRRLMQNASLAKILHIDSTYKVTFEKLPLIVLGATDINKRFHLIGLTITSNETAQAFEFTFKSLVMGVRKFANKEMEPTALMCDAAPAIHNGFRQVFGDKPIILMCYAHVMSNVQRKYKFTNQANKDLVKKDLRILHYAPNEKAFDIGYNLFVQKWKDIEPEAIEKISNSFFKKKQILVHWCVFGSSINK